jgi:hypothetical protein
MHVQYALLNELSHLLHPALFGFQVVGLQATDVDSCQIIIVMVGLPDYNNIIRENWLITTYSNDRFWDGRWWCGLAWCGYPTGDAGHIILTPANQLSVTEQIIWSI